MTGGTANINSGFTVITAGPYTIGVTAINWAQFSAAGPITAGAGLTKTGNALSLQTFSPMAYGAAGDGTTNDTAAVQAAVNAVPAGGKMTFQPGGHTYLITAPITIATTGLEVDLAGSTIKKSASFTASGNGGALNVSGTNVTIRDGVIDGNTAASAPGNGILWTGAGGQAVNVMVQYNAVEGWYVDGSGVLDAYRCQGNGNGTSGFSSTPAGAAHT